MPGVGRIGGGAVELSHTDARLLHALQIEPRATWQDLAPVIGVDPATLARRWQRLKADGLVWVTGHYAEVQTALLEISCDLTKLNGVIEALRQDNRVSVLDITSGDRDMLAHVGAYDLADLSAYAVDRLGAIPGVRSVRIHVANETLVDGASWRLRALTPEEEGRVPVPRSPRPRAARSVDAGLRAVIGRELWVDGRASASDIAASSGYTPQRVADAIGTLRSNGELKLRTDVARGASGWPVSAWYFVEVPARTLEATRDAIAAVPEVRLAFTSPSRYNLIISVWLRRLSDIARFEVVLEQALGGARIADRAVVLRIAKHMNHIVGDDTRSIGVPVDGGFGPVGFRRNVELDNSVSDR